MSEWNDVQDCEPKCTGERDERDDQADQAEAATMKANAVPVVGRS